MIKKAVNLARRILKKSEPRAMHKKYFAKYMEHSFKEEKLNSFEQYEAVITKAYHGIEKGLAYENYRAGFGKEAVLNLISIMQEFSSKYGTDAFCYKTSLCCLKEYLRKNKEHGLFDEEMENKISQLEGEPSEVGGTISFVPKTEDELKTLNFEEFIKDRHTIRHFSGRSVDVEKLKEAVRLAQLTPSACNRQGWKIRIVENGEVLKTILENQNGNRGFGQEIDKMLVVTCDLNCFSYGRELYQGYIDGGMYSLNILYALHFMRIGSVPLSASLSLSQEKNVREAMNVAENEKLVMFIGVGNYPEECLTTRSERREPKLEII